jgi:hypothetical protein
VGQNLAFDTNQKASDKETWENNSELDYKTGGRDKQEK